MKMNTIKLSVTASTLIFLLAFAQKEQPSETGIITKIFIIRHAERDPGFDPPLNREGQERAELIKNILADSGITVIYCPDLIRNRQTAAPLARHLNIKPDIIPFKILDNTREVARYVKKQIWNKDLGKRILFIGNQKGPGHQMGNIQEFYMAVGGENTPLTRYPDMHIVTLKDTTFIKSVRVIYGENL